MFLPQSGYNELTLLSVYWWWRWRRPMRLCIRRREGEISIVQLVTNELSDLVGRIRWRRNLQYSLEIWFISISNNISMIHEWADNIDAYLQADDVVSWIADWILPDGLTDHKYQTWAAYSGASETSEEIMDGQANAIELHLLTIWIDAYFYNSKYFTFIKQHSPTRGAV